jgi:hypothetical protein
VVELRLDLTDARELDLEFFDELSDLRRQQGDLAGVTLPGGSGRARWSGWAGRSGLPRWAAWPRVLLPRRFGRGAFAFAMALDSEAAIVASTNPD